MGAAAWCSSRRPASSHALASRDQSGPRQGCRSRRGNERRPSASGCGARRGHADHVGVEPPASGTREQRRGVRCTPARPRRPSSFDERGVVQRWSLVSRTDVVLIVLGHRSVEVAPLWGWVETPRHARALGCGGGTFERLYNRALEPSRLPSCAIMSLRRAAQRGRYTDEEERHRIGWHPGGLNRRGVH